MCSGTYDDIAADTTEYIHTNYDIENEEDQYEYGENIQGDQKNVYESI